MTSSPKLPRPRPLHELKDVHDYLDDVRLRPGVYVRGSSIHHLASILYGYRVACEINGIPSTTDFDPGGPFNKWLGLRLDLGYESSLGWSREIELAAEAAGTPPLDLFFSLLDEFRAERGDAAQNAAR
ncbi:hypothetical protein [Streptomyces sp. MI02-7b]|uniref:hypothetical protein n=1 Tax=Streptomyces sp. MI02-7b TaxID=462941 RepID=UPI0029AD3C3C|nr:hypothetical protein [Streptomyces sp. MI02-7b]MDX3074643.1 hypothetical protein [Streptomyces sp. MI02-7b]